MELLLYRAPRWGWILLSSRRWPGRLDGLPLSYLESLTCFRISKAKNNYLCRRYDESSKLCLGSVFSVVLGLTDLTFGLQEGNFGMRRGTMDAHPILACGDKNNCPVNLSRKRRISLGYWHWLSCSWQSSRCMNALSFNRENWSEG